MVRNSRSLDALTQVAVGGACHTLLLKSQLIAVVLPTVFEDLMRSVGKLVKYRVEVKYTHAEMSIYKPVVHSCKPLRHGKSLKKIRLGVYSDNDQKQLAK